MNDRRLAIGLYGATVLLSAAAFVCPPLRSHRDDGRTNTIAEMALQRLADGERGLLVVKGKYSGFGRSSADRTAILPHVHLGPEFDDLDFDALVDRQGMLQLRAMTRVDAVRAGRVSPLLKTVKLTGQSKELPNKSE